MKEHVNKSGTDNDQVSTLYVPDYINTLYMGKSDCERNITVIIVDKHDRDQKRQLRTKPNGKAQLT